MKKKLVIVGAGGFAREALCWAEQDNREILAFVANSNLTDIDGIPVYKDFSRLAYGLEFLVAVGDPILREKLWYQADQAGLKACVPVIHHSVVRGRHISVERGSIICPNCVLTTNVQLGLGVILNLGVTVGHDVRIGAFTTVAPGANISGNVHIGAWCNIGTNAAIREKTVIDAYSVLGMGSVLVKHMPAEQVWAGNPAKPLLTK